MNKELKEQLTEFLKDIQNAQDFAVSQAPEVIQQMLTWHLVEAIGLSIFGLIFSFVAYKCWVYFSACINKDEPPTPKSTFALVFAMVGTIFGPVLFFAHLYWLQILIAPKWYIVQQINQLVS